VDATAQILRDEMSAAYALDVPLIVDVRVGTNWDEMTRIPQPATAHA
jgi:DNA polymerase I-like protein with 3'-5' exonuclease and polymerase domains